MIPSLRILNRVLSLEPPHSVLFRTSIPREISNQGLDGEGAKVCRPDYF